MENKPGADRHGPGVRIHPPLIYAGSILSGMGLDNYWPRSMPFGIHGHIYGTIIIVIALLIAGFAILEFHRAGTDVRPDKPDTAMLYSGPYRFTRNPLYIALTLLQITVAVWFNNAWVLVLVIASVIIITQYAIKREERYLEKLFGQEYLDYKQRVRRWL